MTTRSRIYTDRSSVHDPDRSISRVDTDCDRGCSIFPKATFKGRDPGLPTIFRVTTATPGDFFLYQFKASKKAVLRFIFLNDGCCLHCMFVVKVTTVVFKVTLES
jgi:hypothetical protein